MSVLDDLMTVQGVVSVGKFGKDGSLVEYAGDQEIPKELAETTAKFCATGTMMFHTLAEGFSNLAAMDWNPPIGWMYAGGEYTVCVAGSYGIFVKTIDADFNEVFNALAGCQEKLHS